MLVPGTRPAQVYVPKSYNPESPAPLILNIHAFTIFPWQQEQRFPLRSLAEEKGFIYCLPMGSILEDEIPHWNATDYCCDVGKKFDDVGFLRRLVDQIQAEYNIDPKRIYVMGHSNGGFMSYRLACDASDLIAGICSVAGATFATPNLCQPAHPVHILQVHGTADYNVNYGGAHSDGFGHPFRNISDSCSDSHRTLFGAKRRCG